MMESTLFVPSNELITIPASMERATILATRILRSDYHVKILCGLYQKNGGNHINASELCTVLNHNQLFRIERIRATRHLDARVCSDRDFDPWTIQLNPLLLLEMMDREKEEERLAEDIAADANPLQPVEALAPNLDVPPHRRINHIHYCQQRWKFASQSLIAKANAKALKQQKGVDEAVIIQTARMQSGRISRTTAKSLQSELDCVTSITAAVKERAHTTLSVVEKNILMVAILLVHEADHLLNWALSSNFKAPNPLVSTPKAQFSLADIHEFDDIGHLMERYLYGYVISHGYHEALPMPFGVWEILGSLGHIGPQIRIVLAPGKELLNLLRNPSCEGVTITRDLLRLQEQGTFDFDPLFKDVTKEITLGRLLITTKAKEVAKCRLEMRTSDISTTTGISEEDEEDTADGGVFSSSQQKRKASAITYSEAEQEVDPEILAEVRAELATHSMSRFKA